MTTVRNNTKIMNYKIVLLNGLFTKLPVLSQKLFVLIFLLYSYQRNTEKMHINTNVWEIIHFHLLFSSLYKYAEACKDSINNRDCQYCVIQKRSSRFDQRCNQNIKSLCIIPELIKITGTWWNHLGYRHLTSDDMIYVLYSWARPRTLQQNLYHMYGLCLKCVTDYLLCFQSYTINVHGSYIKSLMLMI